MRPIQYTRKFSSEDSFILFQAEISNLMVERKKRLKPIELLCFSVLVMAHNRYGDITSKSAREWALSKLAEYKAGFTPNSLVRYRARLLKKGWLLKTENSYRIAPVFDFKMLPRKHDRVFVFSVGYTEAQP